MISNRLYIYIDTSQDPLAASFKEACEGIEIVGFGKDLRRHSPKAGIHFSAWNKIYMGTRLRGCDAAARTLKGSQAVPARGRKLARNRSSAR